MGEAYECEIVYERGLSMLSWQPTLNSMARKLRFAQWRMPA